MAEKEELHMGKFVWDKIKERSISVPDFANMICLERSTVYRILKQRIIKREILEQMTKAIDFDFVSAFYEIEQANKQKQTHYHKEIMLPEEAIKELEEYKKIDITISIQRERY